MKEVVVVAKMRTKDGLEITHNCKFAADEWQRFDRFVAYARELAGTTLLSTNWDFRFSLSADDDGVEFEPVAMPHPDHVRALLLLMRPFVLKDEETNFERVTNILLRRLDHPAFRTYLERQNVIFDGQRWQVFKFVGPSGIVVGKQTEMCHDRAAA
jgi:hypothetical protein